ncbi:MAG: hypothetical protein ABI693_17950 [Bryobacteraceae bacterium]
MGRISILFFVVVGLSALPGVVLAQGTSGSGTFGGTVQPAFTITTMSNGVLATAMGTFGTLPVGQNTLSAPPPVAFRVRSNAPYKLMVQVGALVGMTDGVASADGSTAQGIVTGNFGFGFTAPVDPSGNSVVGGGSSPIRVDTIVTGFDVQNGWPAVSGQSPNFTKTLHDVYGHDVQILGGPRISASGDNSSDDNSLTVTVGIAILPQYLSAGNFSGTLTFTIASSGL